MVPLVCRAGFGPLRTVETSGGVSQFFPRRIFVALTQSRRRSTGHLFLENQAGASRPNLVDDFFLENFLEFFISCLHDPTGC